MNNREAGDLRRHRGHYDVIVMLMHQVTPRLSHRRPGLAVTIAVTQQKELIPVMMTAFKCLFESHGTDRIPARGYQSTFDMPTHTLYHGFL